MRATLVAAVLGLTIVTGCSSPVDVAVGEAAPTESPSPTESAEATDSPTAVPPKSGGNSTTGRTSKVRGTDWANVTLADLFKLGTVTFRDGKAHLGYDNCWMLPGGAKPVYAEFINEEPASAPAVEDALVLVECGGDSVHQALVPVQVSADGRSYRAVGEIEADPPTAQNKRMVFTAYRFDAGKRIIVATVKKADGTTETRRYRNSGPVGWERF